MQIQLKKRQKLLHHHQLRLLLKYP
jgi:hypothetical protein